MIEIKNYGQVISQIEAWEAEVAALVTAVGRGLSVEIFEYTLEISPQYSGDFTANWKYSLNHIDPQFEPGLVPVKTNRPAPFGRGQLADYIAGDMPAINIAKGLNLGRDAGFKLGDTAYISNSAEHDTPYAIKIWDNQISFRPGNAEIQSRVIDRMHAYPLIDAATALRLARRRLA